MPSNMVQVMRTAINRIAKLEKELVELRKEKVSNAQPNVDLEKLRKHCELVSEGTKQAKRQMDALEETLDNLGTLAENMESLYLDGEEFDTEQFEEAFGLD